jgi:hypothetical protein
MIRVVSSTSRDGLGPPTAVHDHHHNTNAQTRWESRPSHAHRAYAECPLTIQTVKSRTPPLAQACQKRWIPCRLTRQHPHSTHSASYPSPLIRRRIWALNLPAHRLVEVVEEDGYFYGHSVVTVANLYVCRESRSEALKTHPLSFSVNFAPPMIPINFDKDTLLLARNLNRQHVVFQRNCNQAELARVKSLMADTWLQCQIRTHDDRGWRLCGLSWSIFSGLREYSRSILGKLIHFLFGPTQGGFRISALNSRGGVRRTRPETLMVSRNSGTHVQQSAGGRRFQG